MRWFEDHLLHLLSHMFVVLGIFNHTSLRCGIKLIFRKPVCRPVMKAEWEVRGVKVLCSRQCNQTYSAITQNGGFDHRSFSKAVDHIPALVLPHRVTSLLLTIISCLVGKQPYKSQSNRVLDKKWSVGIVSLLEFDVLLSLVFFCCHRGWVDAFL